MRALSLLSTLQMLHVSAKAAIDIMPPKKPIKGFGKVHNIAHLLLQRGSYFTGQILENEHKQWISNQGKLTSNQLHAKMSIEIESIYYAEGYRFDQGTGDLELCSWCVDGRAFHSAIDGIIDRNIRNCHDRFGYIGIAFTPTTLVQAQQEQRDDSDVWILPWLLHNWTELPGDSSTIFEP